MHKRLCERFSLSDRGVPEKRCRLYEIRIQEETNIIPKKSEREVRSQNESIRGEPGHRRQERTRQEGKKTSERGGGRVAAQRGGPPRLSYSVGERGCGMGEDFVK